MTRISRIGGVCIDFSLRNMSHIVALIRQRIDDDDYDDYGDHGTKLSEHYQVETSMACPMWDRNVIDTARNDASPKISESTMHRYNLACINCTDTFS